MIRWLFLRCQGWKCTDFTGQRTCQVVIAQPKHCKEPRQLNVCWKNRRCHLGMLRAVDFQGETASLPPEPQPYKAKGWRGLPQLINLTHTACSLSALGSDWLNISSVMERMPLPGRPASVPILSQITNTHLAIELLWVLLGEMGEARHGVRRRGI